MSVLTVPADRETWPTLGEQVCDWIENNLCFGPGDLCGQSAVLDDEKRFFLWRMYEVYPKNHARAGRRRFRRCALSLPKGTAKTELSAWIAAAELHPEAPVRCVGWKGKRPIGGPVTDPFIVFVANTAEQSDELAFGALRVILTESGFDSTFDIGLERIVRKRGYGKAVSVAAAPNARDGARTTYQVFDETHRHTRAALKQAHQTMMANLPKRKLADAWALETTTAPEPGMGSIAEDTMEYARSVSDGRIVDSSLFYFHRQASDQHDLSTEDGARAAVIEAAGPAAAWRDIDGIIGLWRDPTTDRTYWERVYTNRLVQSTRQAFDVVRWKALAKPHPVAKKTRIVIGFDGAQFQDSTAIVAVDVLTGYAWLVKVWERPATWPADKEWQVPTDEVDAEVRKLFADFDVWRFYGDPPYWQSWIARWRGDFGEERVIEWWSNRRRQMSAALENFETALRDGEISHDGSADLARHLGNARRKDIGVDDQGKTLWLICKERHDSPFKIDAAMALTLAWEARTDAIASGLVKKPKAYRAPKIWTPGGFRPATEDANAPA